MPRNVRNFWIEIDVDGRKTRVALGPQGIKGGFKARVFVRDQGIVSKAGTMVGYCSTDNNVNLVVYFPKKDYFVTVGFSKTGMRELRLFDMKKIEKPIQEVVVDAGNSPFLLFLDRDLELLYLAGKGEKNVKFYHTEKGDKLTKISVFTGSKQQLGMCMLPKLTSNVHVCLLFFL